MDNKVVLFNGVEFFITRRSSDFFFTGEGPRCRRYGRTTALRLLVQPFDEDEDDYFLSFSK
jgi:hypothetical protein